VLRLMRSALAALEEAPRMLRGRLASLLALTVLAWCAEVAVAAVAIPALGTELGGLSASILSMLAGVSSGATALMPTSGERMAEALGISGGVEVYRACLVIPALVAGAWAASLYLPWRGRRGLQGERA
jgi:hypothetical protein